MRIKSFWIHNDIDEDKLKKVALEQERSLSYLINHALIKTYDILKDKKK